MTESAPLSAERIAQPENWRLHVSTIDVNLGEIDRGLSNGMFGLAGQPWANAAMAMATVHFAREIIKGLCEESARLLAASTAQKAEIARLKQERDLAIAHDRQPYPTAFAYESACAALATHRARVEELEAHLTALRTEQEQAIEIYTNRNGFAIPDEATLPEKMQALVSEWKEVIAEAVRISDERNAAEAEVSRLTTALETSEAGREWLSQELVTATELAASHLAECVALRRSQEWQAIETAPKDMTEILGDFYGLRRVMWWSDIEGWMLPSGAARVQPLHWMPLPPPAQEQK